MGKDAIIVAGSYILQKCTLTSPWIYLEEPLKAEHMEVQPSFVLAHFAATKVAQDHAKLATPLYPAVSTDPPTSPRIRWSATRANVRGKSACGVEGSRDVAR